MDLTIIIPVCRQPHLLLQAVDGIIRHSTYSPKILVSFVDTVELPTDWSVDTSGVIHVSLVTIEQALSRIAALYDGYPIRAVSHQQISGVTPNEDLAAAVCEAVAHVDTEWVCPVWDADMYALPRWDYFLEELRVAYPNNSVLQPMVVRDSFGDLHCGKIRDYGQFSDMPCVSRIPWTWYINLDDLYARIDAAQPNVKEDLISDVLSTTSGVDTTPGIHPQCWRMRDMHSQHLSVPPHGGLDWAFAALAEQCNLTRYAHRKSLYLHKVSIVGCRS